MTRLEVHLYGELVGHLAAGASLEYTFSYAKGAADRLSCSLPLRKAPYDRHGTKAFFRGLLPEEKRRAKCSQKLQIEPDDDIALLAAIGGDCAGAVQILPNPPIEPLEDLAYGINDRDRFCDDVRAGILISREARLSLTGAQLKEPVVLDGDGTIRVPRDGRPTTHILKVPPQPGAADGYADLVLNEYLCLTAAKRLGEQFRAPMFETASVRLLPFTYFRGGPADYVLSVERFDRMRDAAGVLRRVHQEDFCQATGSLQRYAKEGGPTFVDLAAICDGHAQTPGLDRLKIFYAAVYNFIIGNCDAHGRNFSLQRFRSRKPALAPLYDLVSTTAYGDMLSKNMAMSAGAVFCIDDIDMHCIVELAGSLNLAPRTARARAIALAEAAVAQLQSVRAEMIMDSQILDEITISAVGRLDQIR